MNTEHAKTRMLERMSAHAEKFKSLGFITNVRLYYTDKELSEYEEYKKGSQTLWCELNIRTPEMEEDDGLVYELFADINKNGIDVKGEGPENEDVIENSLNELYENAAASDDPKESFTEEYKRISAEFDETMKEFERKIKRLKYISYAAISVVVLSLAITFISSLF